MQCSHIESNERKCNVIMAVGGDIRPCPGGVFYKKEYANDTFLSFDDCPL